MQNIMVTYHNAEMMANFTPVRVSSLRLMVAFTYADVVFSWARTAPSLSRQPTSYTWPPSFLNSLILNEDSHPLFRRIDLRLSSIT